MAIKKPSKDAQMVRVLVKQPAFVHGVRRKPGQVVTISMPPGGKPPLWGEVLPENPVDAKAVLKAAYDKLDAHHKRPALATMSELNRANADLSAVTAYNGGTPPTAAQAAVAAAAGEKAAAAAASAEQAADAKATSETGGDSMEDILR